MGAIHCARLSNANYYGLESYHRLSEGVAKLKIEQKVFLARYPKY